MKRQRTYRPRLTAIAAVCMETLRDVERDVQAIEPPAWQTFEPLPWQELQRVADAGPGEVSWSTTTPTLTLEDLDRVMDVAKGMEPLRVDPWFGVDHGRDDGTCIVQACHSPGDEVHLTGIWHLPPDDAHWRARWREVTLEDMRSITEHGIGRFDGFIYYQSPQERPRFTGELGRLDCGFKFVPAAPRPLLELLPHNINDRRKKP